MNDRAGGADLIPFSCSRCHQVVAVEDASGPQGWQLSRGLWVCDGCSQFDPQAPAVVPRKARGVL